MNAPHATNALTKATGFGLLVLLLLMVTPAWSQSQGVTLLEDTFDTPPGAGWSTQATATAPATGEKFLGQFAAESVTLSLKDLPDHTWVRVEFDVYAIGSWDGNSPTDGPDLFRVDTDDGRPLVRTTFGWRYEQAYPGQFGVHTNPPRTGSTINNALGFTWKSFAVDDIYHIQLVFPHAKDTLGLTFASTQNEAIDNESWGLDNVTVTALSQAPIIQTDEAVLQRIWDDLGSDDPGTAQHAMQDLVAAGEPAITFIAPKLQAAPVADLSGSPSTHAWVSNDEAMIAKHFDIIGVDARRVALAEQALKIIASPQALEAVATIQRPEPPTADATLALTVREAETGQPIPNQQVTLQTRYASSSSVTTDENGVARIHALGSPPSYLSLRVAAPGRVPMDLRVINQRDNQPLPESLAIDIPKGTSIGGQIVNESGDPVPNASVNLLVPGIISISQARVAIRDHVVITDTDGRWRCDIVPAEFNDIWIRLTHPDYIDDPMYGSTPKPTIEQLRDMSGVMVMKAGLTLEGFVTDAQGNPVPDAQISQGSDRHGTHYPSAPTDDQGRFIFKSTAPGSIVLTTQSPDHAPDVRSITLNKQTQPVQITLQPGNTIKGRVVDAAGEPIDDVWIVSDTWRNYRTLELSTRTGPDGRFEFTNAPDDGVEFAVLKQGYADLRDHVITAGSAELTITMNQPQRVFGTVIDAETKQPIPSFVTISGVGFDNNSQISWRRQDAKPQHDGSFEQTFSYPYPQRYIRVEAPGYAPIVSRAFTMDEQTVDLTFELTQAQSLEGTVTDAQGQPVLDAEVYLTFGLGLMQIKNGRVVHSRDYLDAKTDEQGRFSFPPQDEGFLILAISDSGYAELDATEIQDGQADIKLTPWVTVTGTLLIGDQPRAGEHVSINEHRAYIPDKPRPYHDLKATTDEQGRFAFDRVPAGECSIGRHIKLSENSSGMTMTSSFSANPGESIDINLGGTGRPVVGQFAWPQGTVNTSFGFVSTSLRTKTDRTAMLELRDKILPEDFVAWSLEEKQAWTESDAGKKAVEKYNAASKALIGETRTYNFRADPDGKFIVDNVEPGIYTLTLQAHQPPPANQCGTGEPIAQLNTEITVPPLPEGTAYLSEPLDVGTLTLTTIKPAPQVGEAAPDFTVPLLDLSAQDPQAALSDATQLSLSDLKGKVVLLDFWATWCGPCVAETPNLKAVWDAFGNDNRFEMVALSLDASPADPTKYAKKNGITWTQAYLGDWGQDTVTKRYAVRGIPSIWLIGPDGKVLAKGLRGDNIRSTVESTLNNMPQ